jgi:epsilon-lactone hydrolase
MLRLLGIAFGAVFAVLWRRARRGPGRPSWSFEFEALAETMRRAMTWFGSLDPPALRRAMALLVGRAREQRHVHVREAALAGRAATWTEPRGPRTSRVVVYLHGGGYVAGSAKQDAAFVARLAVASGCRVVALDYRLAPEHPCPDAIGDVVAACTALRADGVTDIVLAGISAGGGLALATLVALRERGEPLPSRAALVSPQIDARTTAASFAVNARYDTFDAHAVGRWTLWYAAGAEHIAGDRALPLDDPRVSPALADPAGLPPLAIHIGDAEVLLDDVRAHAVRAAAAGVDVTLRVWPDMIHAFPTFGERFETANLAVRELGEFLRAS